MTWWLKCWVPSATGEPRGELLAPGFGCGGHLGSGPADGTWPIFRVRLSPIRVYFASHPVVTLVGSWTRTRRLSCRTRHQLRPPLAPCLALDPGLGLPSAQPRLHHREQISKPRGPSKDPVGVGALLCTRKPAAHPLPGRDPGPGLVGPVPAAAGKALLSPG